MFVSDVSEKNTYLKYIKNSYSATNTPPNKDFNRHFTVEDTQIDPKARHMIKERNHFINDKMRA